MCGICGLLSTGPGSRRDGAESRVAAMLQVMGHRGPDGRATLPVAHGALGASRLTIRGLLNGMQPIVDADSGVVAVCNGEIDNHRELRAWLEQRGRPVLKDTDVAVIPGLYLELGAAFVERLEGAFACAVYDPRQGKLIIARDLTGERPLFYWQNDGMIGFASELSGVLSQFETPECRPDAVARYLTFGFFTAPDTPVVGVEKLRPGEIMTFDLANAQRETRRYWRWPVVERPKQRGSVDAFDAVFRAAVDRQSDVDVPYGVFLSGGIDSSLVSAVLRSLRPQSSITAYTIRFREESYDEGDYANRVAALFDFHKRDIWVGPDEIRDEIERLVRLCGEPLADPAWAPAALCARSASAEIKLALAGEGADELFGGYPTYAGIGLANGFLALPHWLQRGISAVVERWPDSDKKMPVSYLVKRFLRGINLPPPERHRLWTSHTPPPVLEALIGSHSWPVAASDFVGEALDCVQRYDLEHGLGEGLLTKADRSGMSTGVEIRTPFLDSKVLEFSAALAGNERVRGLKTKAFLKSYAVRYLPRDIVERRKRGLSVPLTKWLRGPLADWMAGRLGSGRLASVGIARDVPFRIMEEHLSRAADHTRTLWALAVLDIWLETVDTGLFRSLPPASGIHAAAPDSAEPMVGSSGETWREASACALS
ncbi:asparagine synthase (glutamine-hydrolyzing) [Methylolobus aquaticus]